MITCPLDDFSCADPMCRAGYCVRQATGKGARTQEELTQHLKQRPPVVALQDGAKGVTLWEISRDELRRYLALVAAGATPPLHAHARMLRGEIADVVDLRGLTADGAAAKLKETP